jgi:hypothetical protein
VLKDQADTDRVEQRSHDLRGTVRSSDYYPVFASAGPAGVAWMIQPSGFAESSEFPKGVWRPGCIPPWAASRF